MTYLSRGVLFEALGKLVCLDKGLRTSHCLTFCEARSSDELYILRADASNLELDLVLGVRFGVPSDTEGCSTLIYSDRPPPSALRPPPSVDPFGYELYIDLFGLIYLRESFT